MTELEQTIGFSFRNPALLRQALTHTSFANENTGADSNERLEFLGDSVLNFIVTTTLYARRPDCAEGELTRTRASYVCEGSLAQSALALGLDKALLVGKGELLAAGRRRPSIMADAFEAVLGAIYLDGGVEPARRYVEEFLLSVHIPPAIEDFKTALQEKTQRRGESPVYTLTGESGPDHEKMFIVSVSLAGNTLATGSGRSKKAAEQDAARQALPLVPE